MNLNAALNAAWKEAQASGLPYHRARDRVAFNFLCMSLTRLEQIPFRHQAEFYLALNGQRLGQEEYSPSDFKLDSDLPIVAKLPEGDFFLIQQPVMSPRTYDRFGEEVTEDFPTHHEDGSPEIEYRYVRMVDLPKVPSLIGITAAYKAGKSDVEGKAAAAFGAVGGARVDIIATEYSVGEPEFDYLTDLLLSEDGWGLKTEGKLVRRPKDGRMYFTLAELGSHFECRSWDRVDALKGKERDLYVWGEFYQFIEGLEAVRSLAQNLSARKGKNLIATTPDRPTVDDLIRAGQRDDGPFQRWRVIADIHRKQNPYTFDFDEFLTDLRTRTKEKFTISWEGASGQWVGSCFDFRAGTRQFDTETHPELWRDPDGEVSMDNLRVPEHYKRICGVDTGTRRGSCSMVVSPEGEIFVVSEACNYRYAGGQIEQLPEITIPVFCDRITRVHRHLGGSWTYLCDPNSQFRRDFEDWFWMEKGTRDPELRTDKLREFFQHDKIFFAPWLNIIPYECEVAHFPSSESSTGKYRRVKINDHCLDGLEHGAARAAHDVPSHPAEQPPQSFIDSLRREVPDELHPYDPVLGT